ncbi:MAG: Ig-like domain-containing protein [Eggerthellaceae bacterium]|nr:Ig-like domain-containing protein [Eggerthellaceae bacterium]
MGLKPLRNVRNNSAIGFVRTILLATAILIAFSLVVGNRIAYAANATPSVTVAKAASGSVVIRSGSTYDLGLVTTKGAKVTIKSSKTSVAKSSANGKVKGNKAGKATITITAKSNGAKATKKVKVTVLPAKKFKAVKSISAQATKTSLVVGESTTIETTFNPSNASNKNLVYKSSNANVLTVSASGVVKGVKAGNALVRVTSAENAKASRSISFKVTNSVESESSMELSENSLALDVGQTARLYASIKPSGVSDASIAWSSSNADIATVEDGLVVGKGVGTAIVKAQTSSGLSAECEVVVGMTKANSFEDFAEAVSSLMSNSEVEGGIGAAGDDEYRTARLIVKDDGEDIDYSMLKPIAIVSNTDTRITVLQFQTRQSAKSACVDLSNRDHVVWVEPDEFIGVSEEEVAEPNITTESYSWGVGAMKADKLANSLAGINRNVTVAVVDSGVSQHSLLNGRIASGGHDFIDNDDVPTDWDGHGTHVAGTIMDCTPGLNVTILPERVLDDKGEGSTLGVSLGIEHAVKKGADVINLSLGNKERGHSNYLENSVTNAVKDGTVVVVAAGNENDDTRYHCPSCVTDAIVVSAINSSLSRCAFSNYGSSVDVAAPGYQIMSCRLGGGYVALNGTSMAAPHVSAAAAMVKLKNPSFTPAQVEQSIKGSCADLGTSGWDKYYGFGIPDLSKFAAVDPSGIALDRASADIQVGESVQLIATVSPSNATEKSVEWSSSNTSVATVTGGNVTGRAEGTATITVTTVNGKSATCAVTVTPSIVEPTGITLDKSNESIEVGSSINLAATVLPSEATNKSVDWSSDNDSVAHVEAGRVTGLKPGRASITASTVNGKTATCIITVNKAVIEPTGVSLSQTSVSMKVGSVVALTASVSPSNASDRSVIWTTSNSAVATVDSGRVTGVKTGTATITASTVNGKTSSCQVTVISNGNDSFGGDQYWVVFTEGNRSNRLEAASFSVSSGSPRLNWNKSLTISGATVSGSITQYALNSSGAWAKIGTYSIPTDWAVEVVATNIPIYDSTGSRVYRPSSIPGGNFNGDRYWVIFTEGNRNNRLEAASFSVTSGNPYLVWNQGLTVSGALVNGSVTQYALNSSGAWAKIGTYSIPTDLATEIVATNIPIYELTGTRVYRPSAF